MKPGDLVLFTGDGGRFDVTPGSKGLVLEVRRNPYGYSRDQFEFDALIDGKIVRDILTHDWMEVISEAR
jgi:hypothetical protein